MAIANVYMSSFGRLRQEVKTEKLTAEKKEIELEEVKSTGGTDQGSEASSSSSTSDRISRARSASSG